MDLAIKDILPIWWSFLWRYAVYELPISAVFGALLGFLVGRYALEAGWSTDGIKWTLKTWSAWGNTFFVRLPVSLVALQQALLKHHAMLISVNEKSNSQE
jgi:hypothetical protein